jgi:DNA primase
MGSTLSPHQAELLRRHFERILLMLDGDKAGRLGQATIAPRVASRMPVVAISLGEGKRPDQLPAEAIQHLVGTYFRATR